MKNLTFKSTDCLFKSDFGEVVNYGNGDVKVSMKRTVTPALTVNARLSAQPNPNIVMSRAPEAVNCCKETARDSEFIFGEIQLDGLAYKWKTDGVKVFTSYEPLDPDNADKHNARRAALFPIVVAYESQDPDMSSYRDKVMNGTATADDAYRYSDAFYYGVTVNESLKEIEVNFGIPEVELEPEKPAAPIEPVKNEDSVLPWKNKNLSSIPNDYSVKSARQGKYRMNISVGEIVEGNDRYDFRQDMLPLSFLDGYVDNATFRDVLRSITGTISSMFRSNKIDETVDCPVNELLAGAAITSIQRNILLVGEPGTGKTMLLRAVCCALGLPVCIIRLNEHSEADALTEEIRVTTNGFTAIKSKTYWYVKYGMGMLVLDDMTNGNTNILFSTLGGTLEAPYVLQVGQTDVPRHPMCFIAATANIGTEGSRAVNEAFISRFGYTEKVEKLSDEEFKLCICERARLETGVVLQNKTERILVDWVFEAYQNTISGVKQFSADLAEKVITLRSAIALMERLECAIAEGEKLQPAAEAIKAFANPLYAVGEEECRDVIYKALDGMSVNTLKGLMGA